MPANLNALIRYKTINSCLHGGKRKWSIHELMEACSDALGESRGRYTLISERTIRDDLRVMKSDILGFNAPIEQEKGLYFYSDAHYSILTLKITDAGLADKIFSFLIHIRNDIQHPELESILEQLSKLTNKPYEKHVMHDEISPRTCSYSLHEKSKINRLINLLRFDDEANDVGPVHPADSAETALTWGEVFKRMQV